MSYLVLSRKYRPQRFSDVIGQVPIIKTLVNALNQERIAHSFLFSGPRGVGKTTVARLLAKSLSCESRLGVDSCGKCRQCLGIAQNASLDVIEIDGASNTGVDDVREIKASANYQPSYGKYKIFIIDEVHMLSINAFNALLKTLEEPPSYIKFIFATTEPQKIPKTVLSRCQRYDFKRISSIEIAENLKKILELESIKVEKSSVDLIANCSDGSMRDALSLTDQILSFSEDILLEEDVSKMLGVLNKSIITDLADLIIQRDSEKVLKLIRGVFEESFDLKMFLSDLAMEFRNLAVAASVKNFTDLLDLRGDSNKENMIARSQKTNSRDLFGLLDMIINGINKIGESFDPYLSAELLFLEMSSRPCFAEVTEISEAISRLEILSKKKSATGSEIMALFERYGIKSDIFLNYFKEKWILFLKALQVKQYEIFVNLRNGTIESIERDSGSFVIELRFDEIEIFDFMESLCKKSSFNEMLLDFFDENLRIKNSLNREAAEKNEAIKARIRKEVINEYSGDKLIEKALRLFGEADE